jgi:hypothetical protein
VLAKVAVRCANLIDMTQPVLMIAVLFAPSPAPRVARPGDISAFLCNILEANNVKPKRVLKAHNLPTHDLQDGHALNTLFQAALPYMPEPVASDTDASGTDHSLIDSQASDASDD